MMTYTTCPRKWFYTRPNTGQGCRLDHGGNSTSTFLLPLAVLPLAIPFDPDDWCFGCDEHVTEVGELDEGGRCDECQAHGVDDFDPGSLCEEEPIR